MPLLRLQLQITLLQILEQDSVEESRPIHPETFKDVMLLLSLLILLQRLERTITDYISRLPVVMT